MGNIDSLNTFFLYLILSLIFLYHLSPSIYERYMKIIGKSTKGDEKSFDQMVEAKKNMLKLKDNLEN